MIERFQIEDLISQDLSGVEFRALDKQSGEIVTIRRFLPVRRFSPFGDDCGGLNAEQQADYEIAVGRLAGLSHPALSAIVIGACDPVDRMPFIVTEWIEGESLATRIAEQKLSAESAIHLIIQALEVCELLSNVLAKEAIWVETKPQAIIISDRGFTFCFSPLKWLGGNQKSRGLDAIVTLCEQVMGWNDRVFSDRSGGGLGGWLKQLRRNAATTTLQQAHSSLAALTCAKIQPTAAILVTKASEMPSLKASSKVPLVAPIALGFLVAVLTLIFVLTPDSLPEATRPLAGSSSEAPAILPPIASRAKRSAPGDCISETPATPAQTEPAKSTSGPVILLASDYKALLLNKSREVIVEGISQSAYTTKSGKTVYLSFVGKTKNDLNVTAIGIRIGASTEKEIETEKNRMLKKLESFVGKKIRVSGKVSVRKKDEIDQPLIRIKDLSAVRIIK